MTNSPYKRRVEIPGQSPVEDRLLAMVAALTSEVAILRSRLDTLERLADQAGIIDRSAIETFAPDAAAETEREALRSRLIDKVFRPLRDAARRAAGDEA
jgi:hypothetical protein